MNQLSVVARIALKKKNIRPSLDKNTGDPQKKLGNSHGVFYRRNSDRVMAYTNADVCAIMTLQEEWRTAKSRDAVTLLVFSWCRR